MCTGVYSNVCGMLSGPSGRVPSRHFSLNVSKVALVRNSLFDDGSITSPACQMAITSNSSAIHWAAALAELGSSSVVGKAFAMVGRWPRRISSTLILQIHQSNVYPDDSTTLCHKQYTQAHRFPLLDHHHTHTQTHWRREDDAVVEPGSGQPTPGFKWSEQCGEPALAEP